MRAGSELRVPVAVIGWAGTRALTTCHTGATCQHCTCVQYSTHCTVSHQQHHYILSHRQSVSNSGSSQTLVTKKNYFCGYPIVVKDWYFIWLRSELWMTLMKNFICGYLDRDNHHDIVSISFDLRKKVFAQKIFPAHNTFEMSCMVTSH